MDQAEPNVLTTTTLPLAPSYPPVDSLIIYLHFLHRSRTYERSRTYFILILACILIYSLSYKTNRSTLDGGMICSLSHLLRLFEPAFHSCPHAKPQQNDDLAPQTHLLIEHELNADLGSAQLDLIPSTPSATAVVDRLSGWIDYQRT